MTPAADTGSRPGENEPPKKDVRDSEEERIDPASPPMEQDLEHDIEHQHQGTRHAPAPSLLAKREEQEPEPASLTEDGQNTSVEVAPVLTKFHMVILAGTMMFTSLMMESALAVQWVVSAYTLAYGVGLLVAGRLADLYGRRKLFLFGLIVGTIGNIISAVLPNRIALTVFRALTGLGFSISAPASFGITGTTFRTEPARTAAFAALGLGTPVGAIVGEIVGGVMAGTWRKGWQYIYFLIAGLGLIPILGGFLFVPNDEKYAHNGPPSASSSSSISAPTAPGGDNRKVDWLGSMLVTLGLSLLMFSVTQAGLVEKGWKTPYIPPVFALSIVFLIVFGLWEHHAEQRTTTPPIIKLSVFSRHNWRVTAILGIAFFDWCGVCGWVYLTSIWWQQLLGYSAMKNAVYILPAPVTGILISFAVIPLVQRVNAPLLLALGSICTGLANALFAWPAQETSYWRYGFWGGVMQPWGGDLTIPIGSIMISNLCADNEQSVCGALFSVSMQVAGTIDICLSSLIHSQMETTRGLIEGLRVAFWFNAACCWVVLIIILVAFRKVGLAKDVAKVV
ncbi:hypothetical protein I316_02900 [Kwoniella heveanensis BCC8398]|uniref:Major facilitator superfamily (MFS) profile domain-containing protein n=1 Tax=Kwoniella heveanensis BCC8398 TaxID=1296120 RepID=A0A1B9GWE2_9TREE|nr:hypothetical protein I316_02900 [Kwoniella heveanensis BCC8398]